MANSMKDLDCIFCKQPVQVDSRTGAALCGDCVAKLSDAPIMPKPTVVVSIEDKKARKAARLAKKAAKLEAKKTAKKGRGRGWHLKQLFEFDGEFYSFGKKIDDAAVAKIRKALKAKG